VREFGRRGTINRTGAHAMERDGVAGLRLLIDVDHAIAGGQKVGAVSLVDSIWRCSDGSDRERREDKMHTRDEMGEGGMVVCYDARPGNDIYTFMLRRLWDKYDRKRLNVKMKVKGHQPCWQQTRAAPDIWFRGYGRGRKVE